MRVLRFRPRFEAPIRAGTKRQTVRPTPKGRPLAVGELVSLRRWSGVPYKSPQAVILPSVIVTAVLPIRVAVDVEGARIGVELDGRVLPEKSLEGFARRDGFSGVADMVAYYREQGSAGVEGLLYQWGDFEPGDLSDGRSEVVHARRRDRGGLA